jgi:cytochrome c-type biogenesis protein CcmE
MKISPNSWRIGIAVAIIVGTIGWLAITGAQASKSYYVTIAELGGMGGKAYTSNLRVEGFVKPGSIEQDGPNVTFLMNEFESHNPKAPTGRVLKVAYKGSEPPPDTFKDDSQALPSAPTAATASSTPRCLQAKCASKYAPAGRQSACQQVLLQQVHAHQVPRLLNATAAIDRMTVPPHIRA